MKRVGTRGSGYTVIEVMIFLAVSSVLMVAAMLYLSGQQRRNEFATGIRDIQSQLTDMMNDVATGYYNNTGDFTCTAPSAGPPTITTPGSAEQGSNADCTFVGRAIQFAPTGADRGPETANIYTLIGRRLADGTASDASSLYEAVPNILDPAEATLNFPYGIEIKKVYYDSSEIEVGSIAFVSRYSASNGGITGTQDIDLIPITGTVLGESGLLGGIVPAAKDKILDVLQSPTISNKNPGSGITLCFESGGTNQHANILIGGEGRQTSTKLTLHNGDC